MPNVWFEIEDEAQDAARRAMSQAWEGDTWCEEGSIRQDIIELNEVHFELVNLVKRHRQDVIQLKKDIAKLKEELCTT